MKCHLVLNEKLNITSHDEVTWFSLEVLQTNYKLPQSYFYINNFKDLLHIHNICILYVNKFLFIEISLHIILTQDLYELISKVWETFTWHETRKKTKKRQNRSEASDKGWHKIHSMVKCILKVFTGEKAIWYAWGNTRDTLKNKAESKRPSTTGHKAKRNIKME